MKTTTIFKNGHSQAVRLPKEFRFDGEKVFIEKKGDTVILIPYREPWNTLFESLYQFSDDFLSDRNQPKHQSRDDL
jgi:antitoxin VapB